MGHRSLLECHLGEGGGGEGGGAGREPAALPGRFVLPLPLSPSMLIFGVGCSCPGISRHASRRPVARSRGGTDSGEPGQGHGGCLPLPLRSVGPLVRPSMRPPPRAPRLCLQLCLCLAAAAARQPGSCRDRKNCKVVFSQQELRKRLTPLQYHVTQEKGTESAFEGKYTSHKDRGMYKCIVCGTPLFNSETKYDSGSGWPSFHDVISSDAITFTDDFSHGMHRVETSCSQMRKLRPSPKFKYHGQII
ncbi:methionine-R-sulfoxide reductase B3 isoform X3 [Antechinus flavipes]|uniref:methionine-R-sulfoxide reductase B3 isoform X3 n=1 Tax=Antechinus flavipes TaxID=38775 RepID=UPI002235618E|nr:methionine-R-sulfoxide reductase B3 isoform X3 [Antechinus flavipes]